MGFIMYFELNDAGRSLGMENDCSLRTLTLALNKSYEEIKRDLNRFAKENGGDINDHYTISEYLIQKNFKVFAFNENTHSKNVKCFYMRYTFLYRYSILVNTPNHMFYVDRGLIKDLFDDSDSILSGLSIMDKNCISQLEKSLLESNLYDLHISKSNQNYVFVTEY